MNGTEPLVPQTLADEIKVLFETGIDLCRAGDWQRGLYYLERAASRPTRGVPLPARYYSYLGCAQARVENRVKEGLTYCEHAARDEFWDPEIWVNLSRTRLLADNRRGAVRAVNEGLAIDPTMKSLLFLCRELGVRQPPVISFLSRANPLNYLLGVARHRLSHLSSA